MQENVTIINNDEDYYYAVGQLAYFLVSQSNQMEIMQRETGQFMRANNKEALMRCLKRALAKHSEKCPNIKVYTSLVTEVFGYAQHVKTYDPNKFVEGYFASNVVLEVLENKSR